MKSLRSYDRLKQVLKFTAPQQVRYYLDSFRDRHSARLLLISDREAYCSEQQFAPFHRYREELRRRLGIIFRHAVLQDVMADPAASLRDADVIGLKLSWRTDPKEAVRIITEINVHKPARTKVIYFDGDDDSAIHLSPILPLVDLYVKKHMFRDAEMYRQQFIGKNNLTHYVAEVDGHSFSDNIIPRTLPVQPEHIERIHLAYNLALDDKIVELYGRTDGLWQNQDRPNDIVCRSSMADWLYHLRKGIAPALASLSERCQILLPTQKVSQADYDREMLGSKICVSPFGFGEICWRDFEAVLWGCLLVKPDMSHIRTQPDIFIPYETYIPVKWDFSDLAGQCSQYLDDAVARRRIATQAYSVLSAFYEQGQFFQHVAGMLNRIGFSK